MLTLIKRRWLDLTAPAFSSNPYEDVETLHRGELMQIVAYVLMQVAPGKSWCVAEAASKVEGVKMAHSVTGLYDVIAYVEVAELKALAELIQKIHAIDGVQRTQTAISI